MTVTSIDATGPERDDTQAWYWTPEWQAGEREATAQIKVGDVEAFGDATAMFAALTEGDAPETGTP